MEHHFKVLGICSIIYHSLGALLVVVILPLFLGASLFTNDLVEAGIVSTVGLVITVIVLALTLPGIIGGIGLLTGKRWSRILLMIANALSILSFPLGTALGAYTFWVLTKDEAVSAFEG